ncbi:MAG: MmgE/PrpD family protein [Paracoccaceae bacterium]|nr:MmgE/PrpD family protein [Paracoccaceae bacterium]
MADSSNLLIALADWATSLPPLGAAAERESRLSLIDTIAVMLAGRDEPQVARARDAIFAAGMSGPSRALVADGALQASAAALPNGTSAHALDYDDYERFGSTHPGAVLVGALLAVAEERWVTLGQVIHAHAVGYEAICRLGQALGYGHYEKGWHATATLGPIGGAAAVVHLIGLPEGQMVSAMSLAASMAAGMKRQFGSDAKAVHAGLAARASVEAAMLAAAGIEARPDVIEGSYGFLALYGAADAPGTAAPAAELGAPLIGTEGPMRKPWPCCAYTHRAIEAAEALAARPGFGASAVKRAVLRIPEPYLRVAGFTDPTDPNEARFSAGYCVAAALLDGRITPESFRTESVARPEAQAMLARVELDPYPLAVGLGDISPEAPDTVTLTMADGSEQAETVAHVFGGPGRPMTEEAIIEKFTMAGGDVGVALNLLNYSADEAIRYSLIEAKNC